MNNHGPLSSRLDIESESIISVGNRDIMAKEKQINSYCRTTLYAGAI